MEQHFVTFYSPGTIVTEQTTKPIDKWDIDQAISMARTIQERHSATPFGFRFSTRARNEKELDSKEIAKSNIYYLGGTVLTLQQVKDRADDKDKILIANMEGNGWDRIIENTNSWKFTAPLYPDDVILDFNPSTGSTG